MNKIIGIFFTGLLAVSCGGKKVVTQKVQVENKLNFQRSEVVELLKSDLKIKDLASIGVKHEKTGELQITQLVDFDGDGVMDRLLFQPKIEGNSKTVYKLVKLKEQVKSELVCYSRFVPERTDDYTWENDKVAFRVYGPNAQMLKETGQKGGTLSSGVDAWLKRVEYPVINKWYKETCIDKTGSYHKDTGEGLDNFHVGISRGVGGIAVKNNGKFYYSKNYTKWKTITTGPLRTSFYLEYESWDAGGKTIKESKIISLDKGSNLSRFETSIEGSDEISAGLTLHDKDGEVTSGNGWVSYWQPIDDSEIGTTILADKHTFLSSEKYDVKKKDLSNAYAHLKVQNNFVTYYAGFAWVKSKQYPTKEKWENYLNKFFKRINNPLFVKLVD